MPTHFFTDLEIERIGKGLLDCSLPKCEWTHAGHFAAVLWLLRCRSIGPERVCFRLKRAGYGSSRT
jgi:hypothetical protein